MHNLDHNQGRSRLEEAVRYPCGWRRAGGRPGFSLPLICVPASLVLIAALGYASPDLSAARPAERAGVADEPKPPDPVVSRLAGSLVICGGGKMPEGIRETFLRQAGGRDARIVVIPTASESADGPEALESLDPWKELGCKSVSLLHTRSRSKADDPGFVKPLAEASGVWFGGGDQSRVVEAYLGTATEKAIRAVLERGGVLGGTSAGAALMSRVMITGGQNQASVGTGFGFLPGVVVDQHALRRNRLNRLLGVLADHPELTGVAIDEATALVVLKDRWEVVGESYVVTCRLRTNGKPPHVEIREAGDHGNLESLIGPATSSRR